MGKYNRNVFKVNESAVVEYSRLREKKFDTIYTNYVDGNSLTVSLLNTRSLKRHAPDISRVRRFTESDILCLTDSKVSNDTNMAEIKEQLSSFEIHFNSCDAIHQNLAFCLGQNIVPSRHEIFPGISVFGITEISFSHSTIGIMLLYRSSVSSLATFFETWENCIYNIIYLIIDIVLGDFSIDILNSENINSKNVLFHYTFLVNETTYICDSMSDRVYVNNKSLQKFSFDKTKIVCIHFLIMM